MILLGLVLIGTGLYIRYSRTKPKLVAGLEEMKLKNGEPTNRSYLEVLTRSGLTAGSFLVSPSWEWKKEQVRVRSGGPLVAGSVN